MAADFDDLEEWSFWIKAMLISRTSVYYDLRHNFFFLEKKKNWKHTFLVSFRLKRITYRCLWRCNELTPEAEFILTFEGNRLSQVNEVRLRWQDNNKNMNSIKRQDIKESCERSLKFRSLQLVMLSQTLKTTLTQKQKGKKNSRAMFSRYWYALSHWLLSAVVKDKKNRTAYL